MDRLKFLRSLCASIAAIPLGVMAATKLKPESDAPALSYDPYTDRWHLAGHIPIVLIPGPDWQNGFKDEDVLPTPIQYGPTQMLNINARLEYDTDGYLHIVKA